MKDDRDIEKGYTTSEFVSKLRRLADSLESGNKFEIQIAGERIYVPVRAQYNIEHEREGSEEEIEFQIKWSNQGSSEKRSNVSARAEARSREAPTLEIANRT